MTNSRGEDLYYSYSIEQAVPRHSGHNILTVIMKEKGVNLDGALETGQRNTTMDSYPSSKLSVACCTNGIPKWIVS